MSPVSRPMVPRTWMRRLSQAADHRYASDGNSSSYSSAEDTVNQRQYYSSFSTYDDLSGRSYVDPWDMENYSFLRKQLEDLNLQDAKFSPAIETTQSDFYYVPLDINGSPQYQHKRLVDFHKGQISPLSIRNEIPGLMANVDESDFCNENFDSSLSLIQFEDPHSGFNNNPSRQSERSRFNNQDYHIYTPPSIIKDITNAYTPSQLKKFRRRASVSFCPDSSHLLPVCHDNIKHYTNASPMNRTFKMDAKTTFPEEKIKLNRRKSFHDISSTTDYTIGKQERRKSVLDNPYSGKWQVDTTGILSARQPISRREINSEPEKKQQKNLEKGILLGPENRCSNRVRMNVSFNNEILQTTLNSSTSSPLVYVYETPGRGRKIFLPNASPKLQEKNTLRYSSSRSETQDVFSLDPIEQYLNRSNSRYTMTNYGHLKIDYSCSWNYLDRCIAQKIGI